MMRRETPAEVEQWLAIDREAQYQTHLDKQAREDALLAIARDIPDPEQYAWGLPLEAAEALLSATQSAKYGPKVSRDAAAVLRPYGLVEYGGEGVTAFGWAVRRVLRSHEA